MELQKSPGLFFTKREKVPLRVMSRGPAGNIDTSIPRRNGLGVYILVDMTDKD